MTSDVSVGPSGEEFPLPSPEEYAEELGRVEALARSAKAQGKEVVVVMGVGFVGAVMAAIIADAVDENGSPNKFVVGCQRPSSRSFWKIPLLNRGESPVKAEDPEVDVMISRCVHDKKTLTATFNSDCLALADCVVVDVQCDYTKQSLGDMRTGEVEMAALEATMKTIGEKISPDCLVVIETTVAPGTTEFVAYPIMRKAFQARGLESLPLLAHSYERVMPGKAVRRVHQGLLASLLGVQRGGHHAGRQVPQRGLEHQGLPADRDGQAHRERDHQDRGELLPGHHPGVPQRVEPLRGAQRRRPHQGHRGDQSPPHAQQHDLPGAGDRRLLPAQGRRPGLLGLQTHPGL